MAAPTAAELIAADERRAAQQAYRAAGGSKRRPLRSFTTTDERRAARDEHAARLHEAVEHVQTAEGFRHWVAGLILNPGLSPLNVALASTAAPGAVVNTSARWKAAGYKVAKGESAHIRVTAPGFKPRACFAAEQVGATDILAALEDEPPRVPDDRTLDLLRDALRARLTAGDKPSRVVGAYGAELREAGLETADGLDVFAACEMGGDTDLPF